MFHHKCRLYNGRSYNVTPEIKIVMFIVHCQGLSNLLVYDNIALLCLRWYQRFDIVLLCYIVFDVGKYCFDNV